VISIGNSNMGHSLLLLTSPFTNDAASFPLTPYIFKYYRTSNKILSMDLVHTKISGIFGSAKNEKSPKIFCFKAFHAGVDETSRSNRDDLQR
jgi:hypothetical protein